MKMLILRMLSGIALAAFYNLSLCQIPERSNDFDSARNRHDEWVMFYDSGFVNILPDTVGARYFRLVTFEHGKPVGLVRDYYLSGILQWKGNMLSIDPDTIHGESIQYNPSGTIQARHQFKFGELEGPVTEYYETGELLLESAYKNGKLSGPYRKYAKNGKIVIKGQLVDGKMEGYFEFYHPNGQVETKGYYKNDINDGYFEFYYENGNLSWTGNFVDGVQDGHYSEYYETGELYIKSQLKNDLFEGPYVEYYKNGQESKVGTIQNGLMHGLFHYYYENGQIKHVGNYQNDERHGFFRFYYENGELESEGRYNAGVDTGSWKYYHQTGNIYQEGIVKDGEWHGYLKEYDQEGNLSLEGNYQNGKEHGKFLFYYPSGKLQNVIYFENGVKNGLFEYYTAEGDLVQQGTFKDGVREGYWEYYHENGQVLMKANFKNDVASGEIIRFFENGNTETEGRYEEGVKQGMHIDYFENGNVKNKGIFEDGNRQGYTQFYHENGQLFAEGKYDDGSSTGYWKYYTTEGTLDSQGLEYGDERSGIWKYYYPNGQLKRTGNTVSNSLDGWWQYFSEEGNLTVEGGWKDNLEDSIWFEYYENGILKTRGTYEKGKKIGAWDYFLQDGSLDKKVAFDRGTRLDYFNLYDSIRTLAYRRDWDRVEAALKQAKGFWKAEVKDSDSLDFHYDYLKAQVFAEKYDYEKSAKFYQRALDKIEKRSSQYSYTYLYVLSDRAYQYYLNDDYDQSNKLYDRILKGLVRMDRKITPFYSQDIERYSNSLLFDDKQDSAISLIKNYIALLKTQEDYDPINVIIMEQHLGELYYRHDQYRKSLTTLQNALANLNGSTQQNHWIGTSILRFQAYNYAAIGDIDSTRLLYKKAIKFAENRNDTISYNYFYNHIYLAESYYDTREVDKGLYHANYFLDRASALNFETEYIYLKTLIAKAKLLRSKSNYYLARDTYQLALDFIDSDYSNYELETVEIFHGLGLCYEFVDVKDKERPLEYYKRALEFQLNTDYNIDYLSTTCSLLSKFYLQQEDWKNVKESLLSWKAFLDKSNYNNDYYNIVYSRYYANYHYKRFEYDKAINYLLKAIDVLNKYQSSYHFLHVDLCLELSDIYEDRDQFSKASKWNLKALNILESNGYPESSKYVLVLNQLAYSFYQQQLYDNALVYYTRALKLSSKIEGPVSDYSINQLDGIISTNIAKGNYGEALKNLGELKLRIDSRTDKGSRLRYLIDYFDQLGNVQMNIANNDAAESAYMRRLELAEELYGKDHSSYYHGLSRLASFYNATGKVDKSQYLITKSVDWTEKNYGRFSVNTAWNLQIQAKNFIAMDNYKRGLENFETIRSIYKEKFGEQSWDYITATRQLANVLESLGRNEKSEELFQESIRLIEDSQGKLNLIYTNALHEIAQVYREWGQYDVAISKLKNGIAYLDTLNADAIEYGKFYNLIGLCYSDLREIEPAKEYMYKAKSLYENTEGPNQFGYYIAVNNLGFVKLLEGEYEESEEFFMLSGKRFDNRAYTQTFDVINYENNLGALYMSWGKIQEAGTYWNSILEKLLEKISSDFSFMSENEKAKFWEAYKDDFEHFNSYVLAAYKDYPEEIGKMYDNQLQTKSILLNSSSKDRQRILNSGDTALFASYFEYIEQKEKLVKYYGYSNDQLKEEKISLDSMELLVNNFEKKLNLDAYELQEEKRNLRKSWKDVQKELDQHEAAVEIVRFHLFDKYERDSVLYAAMILTSETKNYPKLIVLPNGKELESKYLKSYQSSINFKIEDPYSYQFYWSEIDKELEGKEVIYFSPDGVYNQVNLNTLKDQENRYLLEKYNIVSLTSTRDIEELKSRTKKAFRNNTAYLFGFPTYSLSHSEIKQQTTERNLAFNQSLERDILLDRFGFSELPGTKTETENISELLTINNWNANLFLGEEALEEYVKSVRNPRVLHIATHGFFLDDINGKNELQLGVNTEVSKSNPLLRSGLLFAGAEETVKGEYDNATENGIFTAFEAMTLDLSETELVVLSACETGRGEVKSGEGVYGLQRAFQIAGTESLIMSLWKVNDAATQELMTVFYNNWIEGKTKKEAFKIAQLSVKQKFKDPYYWGAFVMVGE